MIMTPMAVADREILVDRSPGETRVAVLRDGRLEDILIERITRPWRRGAIVLARVTAVRRELGAVFLDLDGEEGYLDIAPGPPPAEGDAILIEILAEAHHGKAARTTRELSLHGDLVTLTPQRPGHAVSRRITARGERGRLRAALAEAVPDTVGVIARAAARGHGAEAVQADAGATLDRWRRLERLAASGRAPLVLEASSGPLGAARRLAPEAPVTEGRDGVAFHEADIDNQIAGALDRRVDLASGAALVIDELEALTAIDVDSARARTAVSDPSGLASEVAGEVIRQIRLRRLAGLILIDFPRTRNSKARDQLLAELKAVPNLDGGPLTVHGWTRAGLLEITRPRTGPSLREVMMDASPVTRWNAETTALQALRRLQRETTGIAHPRLACSGAVKTVLLGPLRPALDLAGRRLGVAVAIRVDPGYQDDQIEIEMDEGR